MGVLAIVMFLIKQVFLAPVFVNFRFMVLIAVYTIYISIDLP